MLLKTTSTYIYEALFLKRVSISLSDISNYFIKGNENFTFRIFVIGNLIFFILRNHDINKGLFILQFDVKNSEQDIKNFFNEKQ